MRALTLPRSACNQQRMARKQMRHYRSHVVIVREDVDKCNIFHWGRTHVIVREDFDDFPIFWRRTQINELRWELIFDGTWCSHDPLFSPIPSLCYVLWSALKWRESKKGRYIRGITMFCTVGFIFCVEQ